MANSARRILREIIPIPQFGEDKTERAAYIRYGEAIGRLDDGKADGDALIERAKDLFKDDGERRKAVRDRAAACINASGIVVGLSVGATSLLARSVCIQSSLDKLAMGLVVIALGYLCAAVVFGLRAQGPQHVHTLGPDEIDVGKVELAKAIMRYTVLNYEATNVAVDVLRAAQTCLRNGIILAAIAGALLASGRALGAAFDPACGPTSSPTASLVAGTPSVSPATATPTDVPTNVRRR